MNSRMATLLSIFFVVSVTSLQFAGFRVASFVLLALGIAAAAIVRRAKARHEWDRPAVAELDTARLMLAQGNSFEAIKAASAAAAHAKTQDTRNAALTTLARAALEHGYIRRAAAALDQIQPRHAVDLYCYAAVQAANRNPQSAIQALELARTTGTLSRDGAKLLVDLYALHSKFDRAVMSAVQNREVLGPIDCRTVVQAAFDAGEYGPAAILASALFQSTGATEDAGALLRALAYGQEMSEVFRALDDVVWRFRRVTNGRAQARLLVDQLRADRTLPSTTRSELDRMLRVIEGPSAS